MSAGRALIDARIAFDDLAAVDLTELPGLLRVDLRPPAAGPEVELTFDSAAGDERVVRGELADRGVSVLAVRMRREQADGGPADTVEFELSESDARRVLRMVWVVAGEGATASGDTQLAERLVEHFRLPVDRDEGELLPPPEMTVSWPYREYVESS